MVSTRLTEKNEPKMSSVAQKEAEIPCWGQTGSLEGDPLGLKKGHFLGLPIPAECCECTLNDRSLLTVARKISPI